MNLFKVTEQQYGWIFALIAAGLIASSQLNNLFLRKYNSAQIFKTTLLVQTTIGLLLVIGTAMNWLNLYTTILLIFLFLSCQGFSFPNAAALSLAPFSKDAGSASAMMGALQMGFGAFAAALVGALSDGTALPMTGVMAGCTLLGLILISAGRKRKDVTSTIADVEEQAFEQIENY